MDGQRGCLRLPCDLRPAPSLPSVCMCVCLFVCASVCLTIAQLRAECMAITKKGSTSNSFSGVKQVRVAKIQLPVSPQPLHCGKY